MELALGRKGSIAPPPILDQPYQTASIAIAQWDEVITATHWHLYRKAAVDGVDFYVGERELGHIHLDGWVHLATDPLICQALISKGFAETFPYSGYQYWVMFKIESMKHAAHATWLFHLNYLRLRGFAEGDLLCEIQQHSISTPIPTTKQTGVKK